MNRRIFLKQMGYGAAGLMVFSCGGGGNKGGSATVSTSLAPAAVNSDFFVPQLLDTRDRVTDIQIQQGSHEFLSQVQTQTWGFNQGFLGPTLLMEKGKTSNLNYINQLAEPVSVHQHGLHVDGANDGGAQSVIAPGASRLQELAINQPAGTYWYHPHTHKKTGSQVIKGLAGLIIIQDPEEIQRLPQLPRLYGVNDIPVIIQDRSFDANGQIIYQPGSYGKRGYLGDKLMVNGQLNASHTVPSGWIRLRLMNGSNARFYERGDSLKFSDGRQFHVIATDAGLINQPVTVNTLPIGPGERYEVMLKLSANEVVTLQTGDNRLLTLTASNSSFDNSTTALPSMLANIAVASAPAGARVRKFVMGSDMSINGKQMNMQRIDERVPLGATEIWEVSGKGAKHTFHVHGCSFQILDRGDASVPAWERGWKDTAIISGKRPLRLLVSFNHAAPDNYPYMYHCHMLEHEDMGMMGQFTVL